MFIVEDETTSLPSIEAKNNGIILEVGHCIINNSDVMKRLANLSTDKACGVDMVHPLALKNCAESVATPLTLIYSESFAKGELPIQWRAANITPLFKKGNKLNASNNRSVSLTSKPCKILEGIIRDYLQNYFTKNNLISNAQHGFVNGRSCTTNLLETLDYITYNLERGIPIDVALLDFAKAFDTVSHRRLILKLRAYGIQGELLKWIEAFLKNRIQRVVQGDIVSNWKDIFSGVPQGSVIGHFLFVIYINDMPESLINITKLYADDTKIISKVSQIENENSLQKDLDTASEWSSNWLIRFNTDKCLIMHYGTNNPETEYELNGLKLKKSDYERDLGVNFETNLNGRQHIISCASKANSMMGILKMTFVHIDPYLLKLLYTTFIRPLIEFAVAVWSPYYKGDIDTLEKVQHRMTRMIPSLRKLDYERRLEILGLPTLAKWRERGDLLQFFKIFNDIEMVTLQNKPLFIENSKTRGHKQKYVREISRFFPRYNFITNRAANAWNELPAKVVDSQSVDLFKNNLDNCFKTKHNLLII